MFSFFFKRTNKKPGEASHGQSDHGRLSPKAWLGSLLFACAATLLLFTLATTIGKGVDLFLTKATGSVGTLASIMPIAFLLFIIFLVRQIRIWIREAKRDLDQDQVPAMMQIGTAFSAGAKILLGKLLRRPTLENLGREELKFLVSPKTPRVTNDPDF
jgi:hypothetical protein